MCAEEEADGMGVRTWKHADESLLMFFRRLAYRGLRCRRVDIRTFTGTKIGGLQQLFVSAQAANLQAFGGF